MLSFIISIVLSLLLTVLRVFTLKFVFNAFIATSLGLGPVTFLVMAAVYWFANSLTSNRSYGLVQLIMDSSCIVQTSSSENKKTAMAYAAVSPNKRKVFFAVMQLFGVLGALLLAYLMS